MKSSCGAVGVGLVAVWGGKVLLVVGVTLYDPLVDDALQYRFVA